MKIFLFLLIPVLLFSQTPDYPDTLYMKSGKIHPCLITKIDKYAVRLNYKKNMPTSAGLNLVDKIYMEHYKVVYENDDFTTDISEINNFLEQRNEEFQVDQKPELDVYSDDADDNKVSFGVLFVPYVNAEIHQYINDPYIGYLRTYIVGKIESSFESQFSFEINPDLWFIFNLGYGSTYIKERNEYLRTTYYDTTRDGDEYKYDMDFFNFNIGLKYYFTELVENKVSPYFLTGIGKKIASVDTHEKDLYPSPYSQSNSTDNQDEYLEDINSPFYAYIGFGVEYFFNRSLSLNANMRLNYVSYSGEYKYNYSDTYYKRTDTQKTEHSEITKRVGLGLNFYF